MVKMLTKDLTGAALDWAVAKCDGHEVAVNDGPLVVIRRNGVVDYFEPSTNWGWGGPIIEREMIGLSEPLRQSLAFPNQWSGMISTDGISYQFIQYGPTPLIAAMRCFVASRFGAEVDVPDEVRQVSHG